MTIASVRFQKWGDSPATIVIFRKVKDEWKVAKRLYPPREWIIALRSYLFFSPAWEISYFWVSDQCVKIDLDYIGGRVRNDQL